MASNRSVTSKQHQLDTTCARATARAKAEGLTLHAALRAAVLEWMSSLPEADNSMRAPGKRISAAARRAMKTHDSQQRRAHRFDLV